jgi:hypothetical protein
MPGKTTIYLWKQKMQPQLPRLLQIETFYHEGTGPQNETDSSLMTQDQDYKRDAVAVQYLPVLRFSEEFSLPCVDERYLAEVTRTFGSLDLGTFRPKPYTFSVIAENLPPH